MKSLVLKTETENASFYVSSLAIGILEEMRSGGLPLESGIWSLARPLFWEALKKCEGLDARLIDWVSSMDEFDAIHELEGNAYKMIDELLSLLKVSQTESLKGNPSLAIAAYVESNS